MAIKWQRVNVENIKIEKGILKPVDYHGKWKWLLNKMQKGDSIVVDTSLRTTIFNAASAMKKSVSSAAIDKARVRIWLD